MVQTVRTGTVLTVKCKPEWDECQKKQMCNKVKKLNDQAQAGKLQKRPITPHLKKVKNSWQAKYRRDNPKTAGTYTDDCARTNGKSVDADHMVDVQWTGNARGPFEYLDSSVNRSIGSRLDKSTLTRPTGVQAAPNCNCS